MRHSKLLKSEWYDNQIYCCHIKLTAIEEINTKTRLNFGVPRIRDNTTCNNITARIYANQPIVVLSASRAGRHCATDTAERSK